MRGTGPGLLVRAVDGAPVPGATVTLLGRNGRELEVGTAGDDGAYVPSAGDAFAVIASAAGYAPRAGLVVPPNGVAQSVVLTPLQRAAAGSADRTPASSDAR